MAAGPVISSSEGLRAVRRSRRHPGITQYDYLHLRALVEGLRQAISDVPGPVVDVLDVWCGSRPYEDLLPTGARCTGLDVEGNPYGVADLVSDELLPFPDESFDLLLCIQAFQYMPEPEHSVAEFARVLRPGGTAIVASVLGFEYDRRHYEARYTESQLRTLFGDWSEVRIREDGGRTATWTVLSCSLLYGLEQRLRGPLRMLRPAFLASYALVNLLGLALDRAERAGAANAAFPVNLTLSARKPPRG